MLNSAFVHITLRVANSFFSIILLLHLILRTIWLEAASVTQFPNEEIQIQQVCPQCWWTEPVAVGTIGEPGAWRLFAFLLFEEEKGKHVDSLMSVFQTLVGFKCKRFMLRDNKYLLSLAGFWIIYRIPLLSKLTKLFHFDFSDFCFCILMDVWGKCCTVLESLCSAVKDLSSLSSDGDRWGYLYHTEDPGSLKSLTRVSFSRFISLLLAMKLLFRWCHQKTASCTSSLSAFCSTRFLFSLSSFAAQLFFSCVSSCDWCLTQEPDGGHADSTAQLAAIDSFSLKP